MKIYFLILFLVGLILVSGCIENQEQKQNDRNVENKIPDKNQMSESKNTEQYNGTKKSTEPNQYDIYPEDWTQNSPTGESYEFKVNCGSNYQKLEECFLWDLDEVRVSDEKGMEYNLEKDFNINSYSGEVTRRWVLYGPQKAQLPSKGKYIFNYHKNGEKLFTQEVDYTPEVVGIPKALKWKKENNNLIVSWTPPEGVKEGMWYKVIIFPQEGQVISKQFNWDAKSGILDDLPLKQGEEAEFNVAIFFRGGYAYTENIPLLWEDKVSEVSWYFDGEWRSERNPPQCPQQIISQTPVDINLATSILYPGQTRGTDYKAHGGFRFDNSKSDDITVKAPLDGLLVRGSRYIESGEVQYMFDIVNSCGIKYRFDHLLTLSPKFQELAEKLPQPKVDDSRTTNFNPTVKVEAGEVIATAVGLKKTPNVFVDWGVYDLRKRNEASKNEDYTKLHINKAEQVFYGVCWLDWLSVSDSVKVKGLPGTGTEAKKSDYCS